MNNKGFTLIELLAAIILLAIVMSVSTFSVISAINRSKSSSYDSIMGYIEIAVKEYYDECKNSDIVTTKISCDKLNKISNNSYSVDITLKELLDYGFLKSNAKEENNKIIKNPTNDMNINSCKIKLNITIDFNGNVNEEYKFNEDNKEECKKKDLG